MGVALGQSVVVENKPGASGGIAAQAVARAKPDGYTLLLQYSGFQVITPHVTPTSGWDPIKDFAPVANVLSAPQVLDLLAYRADVDVPALMAQVCAAGAPVIVAGSLDTPERIRAACRAGAAGFTVGTAALDGRFSAARAGLAGQLAAIQAAAAGA